MSNFLSFLDKITVAEVTAKAPSTAAKNSSPAPDFMGIRVMKSGKIFPSRLLVDTFKLEYPNAKTTKTPVADEAGVQKKDAEGNPIFTLTSDPDKGTFGLDIIDTLSWTDLKLPEGAPRALLVGISPREASKVDIFKKTVYKEDGTPTTSVMDQGSSTFGLDTLIPTMEEVYNFKMAEQEYVDLKFLTEVDLKSLVPNGLALIPKKIVKGSDAGKLVTVRRENISIFVIEPVFSIAPGAALPVTSTADAAESTEPVAPQAVVLPTL